MKIDYHIIRCVYNSLHIAIDSFKVVGLKNDKNAKKMQHIKQVNRYNQIHRGRFFLEAQTAFLQSLNDFLLVRRLALYIWSEKIRRLH
jgi:hypothetical protein